MVRRLALLIAGLAVLGPARTARADALAIRVNQAIEKGVARMRTLQKEDGSFGGDRSDAYPDGVTALALYTLLRSEVAADDPAVKKAVEWLRYRKPEKTYCAALRILALDALGDRGTDEGILSAAKWLEDSLSSKDHVWGYSPGDRNTDLSNTQFAVLGLLAAEKHGYRTAQATWDSLLLALPGYSSAEGGMFYSTNREAKVARGSMTEAGILVLEVALARVDPKRAEAGPLVRRARESLARAWAYFEKRFTAEWGFEGLYAFRRRWFCYYLWGMERLGAISGRKEFGGHNWYQEGARTLVARQETDGSWGAGHDTCFALLFLRRATFTLVGKEAPPLPEGAQAEPPPPPPPHRPADDTPFVRRWLLLGPFPNPGDRLLEEPPFKEADAKPRTGTVTADRKWVACRSPSDWVDLGRAVGAGENSVTWAFTWLHVAEDRDAVLWIGHDDAFEVFLDGERIHHFHFHEANSPDAVCLPVPLKKGVRRLLVAVENSRGGTGFCLRISSPDGSPARGFQPSLTDARTEPEECAQAQPGFFTYDDLLRFLPQDSMLAQGFADEGSLNAIAVAGPAFSGRWPLWLEGPPKPGKRGPPPGFQGAIGIHPTASQANPARILRKLRVPAGRSALRVRVAAECGASGGRADTLVRLGVYSEGLHWLREDLVGGEQDASKDRWRVLEGELNPWAGKEILLVVETAYGGQKVEWEEAYYDEISVVNR